MTDQLGRVAHHNIFSEKVHPGHLRQEDVLFQLLKIARTLKGEVSNVATRCFGH